MMKTIPKNKIRMVLVEYAGSDEWIKSLDTKTSHTISNSDGNMIRILGEEETEEALNG